METCAHSSSSVVGANTEADHLISMFQETFQEKQVLAIYLLSGKIYDQTLQCLLGGCHLKSILVFMNNHFEEQPIVRMSLDLSSAWSDMLAYYKNNKPIENQIRIIPTSGAAVDTGGIRRQAYSVVFREFAENKYVHIFDGDNTSRLRPATSAMVRSSGLLKLLGKMISHSIYQDGVGFPYLSPACYWYLVGNEDMAIPYISVDLEDLPRDSAALVTQVNFIN